MLVATPDTTTDARAIDLPRFLAPGDLLVLNDTRVIPARLTGIRRRGEAEARIEATLLEREGDGAVWDRSWGRRGPGGGTPCRRLESGPVVGHYRGSSVSQRGLGGRG